MRTPDTVEHVCPRCGEPYREWFRPELEAAAPCACPHCGHDQAIDAIVFENGIWAMVVEDEARDR